MSVDERPRIPFHMAIPREGYEALCGVVEECFGTSLETLAEDDPLRVYRLLGDVVKEMFSPSDGTSAEFIFAEGRKITSDQDGDAAGLAMKSALNGAVETVIVQPLDVVVSVFKSDRDEGGPVLQFAVEPPDLAF